MDTALDLVRILHFLWGLRCCDVLGYCQMLDGLWVVGTICRRATDCFVDKAKANQWGIGDKSWSMMIPEKNDELVEIWEDISEARKEATTFT